LTACLRDREYMVGAELEKVYPVRLRKRK